MASTTRLKLNSSSDFRRKVRIVGKIRAFTDLETMSSSRSSNPWISIRKPDGGSSDDAIVSFVDETTTSRTEVSYKLDNCYGQEDDVEHVFLREVKPLLAGVFNGMNTSVLAYGARGSGKTYMVQGSEEKLGLAAMAVAEMLSMSEAKGSSISVSCYKVYQDHVYDLLEPKVPEVVVLEDRGGKILLKGLSQVPIKSVCEFHKVYYHGCISRKSTQKVSNDALDKAHKGLIIYVYSSSKVDARLIGKLNFVDLAGYEDSKRRSDGGCNLGETAWVNKSLYTLQNVVKALNYSERVPYRESKLTRLLQDSLDGKSQIVMVTCLNPLSCKDTIYTVSLAARSCQTINQESIKKTKNVTMPAPPPKIGRPLSVPTSVKKHNSSQLLVTKKKSNGASSILKGRKLFDGANPIASSTETTKKDKSLTHHLNMESSHSKEISEEEKSETNSSITESSHLKEENSLSDVILDVVSSKFKEEETMLLTTTSETEKGFPLKELNDDNEDHHVEVTSGADYLEKVVVPKEDHHLEKENNISFVDESGSPPLSEQLKKLSNSLKSLNSSTPFDAEMVTKTGSMEGQICGDTIEPKTPMRLVNPVDMGNSCTPREAYSVRSSNIKQSLVKECLTFINSANKDDLKLFKGIGEKRANFIMKLREDSQEPFKKLDDLKEIGLSKKQIDDMMKKAAGDLFS